MKTGIMALLLMISFLLIAGRSSGRLLMKNSQFISADDPSASDRNLNSLLDSESTLQSAGGHVEKKAVPHGQEMNPRSSSSTKGATNENKSSFRLSSTVQKSKKIESSASNKAGTGVLNKVTPLGASAKVNSMITDPQLFSRSTNSLSVSHMKLIRHKSPIRDVDILKSHQSTGDDKKNKRKLGSTPSPGAGH